MGILRKITAIARWIGEHNREPRYPYSGGMPTSEYLWFLSLVVGILCVAAISKASQYGWWVPVLVSAFWSALFGAGLSVYLQSRRATWAIIATYLLCGAMVTGAFQISPALSAIMAAPVGPLYVLAALTTNPPVQRTGGSTTSGRRNTAA